MAEQSRTGRPLTALEQEEMALNDCPKERAKRLRAYKASLSVFDGWTGSTRRSYEDLPEGIREYLEEAA